MAKPKKPKTDKVPNPLDVSPLRELAEAQLPGAQWADFWGGVETRIGYLKIEVCGAFRGPPTGPWFRINSDTARPLDGLGETIRKLTEELRLTLPTEPAPPTEPAEHWYVQFVREGRDAFTTTVGVTKEVYDKLIPHEADLHMGNGAGDAQAWLDKALNLPDVDMSPSELEQIPDDHFLWVAVC